MRAYATRLLTLTLPAVVGALLVGAAAVRSQEPSPATDRHSPPRAAYMRAHFNQTMRLHDAVVRGDLDAARGEAERLAAHAPAVAMPAGARAFQGRLAALAREAATAATLNDAARATSEILGTCGQCHKAMHARATMATASQPDVGGLVGHMLMHQRGADALVEGLVAPSDSSWGEGVRTFAAPKLEAGEAPRRLRSRMERAESALAQYAGEAAQAHRSRDREAVYAKMLATCGGCHSSHARHAGPGPR